jgi:hypothetical protein
MCLYEGHRLWRGWGGAGLLPVILSVLLAGLAGAFWLTPKAYRETLAFPDGAEWRLGAIVAVSFAAFIVLVGLIGYLLSTWFVLSFVTKTTSDASTTSAIVWPGLLACGSFVLFKSVGTHLPSGIWGI